MNDRFPYGVVLLLQFSDTRAELLEKCRKIRSLGMNSVVFYPPLFYREGKMDCSRQLELLDVLAKCGLAGIAELTGQEILDVLEFSVSSYPTAFGGFLHVSGLTFSFDPSVESPVVFDVNKAFVKFDGGPRRVKEVKVLNGTTGLYEPIDPAHTYLVGGTTYLLRDAGDGYEMLSGRGRDTGKADVEALEVFIVKDLKGVIPASRYGQSAGRITVKK